MKGCIPYIVSILNFLKQAGETLLRDGSHGFVLGRKGYSILIVISMPLVPHSFILFQSSTLAKHPSFILLTEGKVQWVNYPAIIPSMRCLLLSWCYLDRSIHWSPHVATTRYDILILRDSAIHIASSLWVFIQLLSYRHLRNPRLLHPSLCVPVPYSASNLCMLAH
jgi:hypothetical protein